MRLTVTIDPHVPETRVDVVAPRMTAEVSRLTDAIERTERSSSRLMGFRGEDVIPLSLDAVLRFHTANKLVYAHTREGTWQVRQRMKDLEASLPAQDFIRINQGEIVNLAHVERMDLSLTASIGLRLRDGTRCYVSRRSLRDFRTALNI